MGSTSSSTVQGLENVPEGAFASATNHQSIVDIIVLGSVLTGDYKWAAKRSLLRVPFLGWHLALAGHVPVDRGAGPKVAAQVISRFVTVLKQGKPWWIFPEGTRAPRPAGSSPSLRRVLRGGARWRADRAGGLAGHLRPRCVAARRTPASVTCAS
ncbi:MAG: 1-acyl-sn-glycerol-3-phosphate acyltransferase [Polyangiaceae bacterium]|nr:1-acyl-sn-glycerol-3-phosphate acyltransferase [Polyangiaceae bacterium]